MKGRLAPGCASPKVATELDRAFLLNAITWAVSRAIGDAVAAEQEACAKLARTFDPPDEDSPIQDGIADAILARRP